MTKFTPISMGMLLVALALGACAKEEGASLTPQQQQTASALQEQLTKLQADSEKVIADLKEKSTESAKAASAELQQALDAAKKAVKELAAAGSAAFEQEKAHAQTALQELGTKYANAIKESMGGGLKLPGM